MELSQKTIDAIAYKVAKILKRELKQADELPEMVSTAEAAKILNITPEYMRAIGSRLPRVKGEGRNGRVLYVRSALLQNY
jgi:hypothetical protein